MLRAAIPCSDYIEFAGRPHFMMIAEGWEEIAGAIDRWIAGPLESSEVESRTTTALANVTYARCGRMSSSI